MCRLQITDKTNFYYLKCRGRRGRGVGRGRGRGRPKTPAHPVSNSRRVKIEPVEEESDENFEEDNLLGLGNGQSSNIAKRQKVSQLETSSTSSSSPTDTSNSIILSTPNCLLCNTILNYNSIYQPVGTGNVDLDKYLDSFCTFVNISLGDHSWNLKEENFPFCVSCGKILEKLHVLYKTLEEAHVEVAVCVRKVKSIVANSDFSSTSSSLLSKSKSKSNKKKSDLNYERMEFFRSQIVLGKSQRCNNPFKHHYSKRGKSK